MRLRPAKYVLQELLAEKDDKLRKRIDRISRMLYHIQHHMSGTSLLRALCC